MRAGPLSDQQLIEKLNRDFINTWLIIPQFENPAQFFKDETAQQWARAVADEYELSVDCMVLSHEGVVTAQSNYDEMSLDGSEAYIKMLDQSTRR